MQTTKLTRSAKQATGKMSLHLRSTGKRAVFLAKRNYNNGQKAALSQLATSHKFQPIASSKFEKNIVTSPHADCTIHGMNLVHRFFENATRWTNKVALVSLKFNCNKLTTLLFKWRTIGMRSYRTQVHLRNDEAAHPALRKRVDSYEI